MSAEFNIIHLSDFHIDATIRFEDNLKLNSLIEELNQYRNQKEIHLVIITGDLTKSGKVSEFQKAQEYLQFIASACKLTSDRILIIPGNHDVDWDDIDYGTIEKSANLNISKEELEKIIGFDNSPIKPYVVKRLTNYRSFVNQFYGEEIFDFKYLSSGWAYKFNNFQIGFAGLNSVTFSNKFDRSKNMVIGRNQILNILDAIQKKVENLDFLITFSHHSLHDLRAYDQRDLTSILKEVAILHLNGHYHEDTTTSDVSVDGKTIVYSSAGAVKNYAEDKTYPQICYYSFYPTELKIRKISKIFINEGRGSWIFNNLEYPENSNSNPIVINSPRKEIKKNLAHLEVIGQKIKVIGDTYQKSLKYQCDEIDNLFFKETFKELLNLKIQKDLIEKLFKQFESEHGFSVTPNFEDLAAKFFVFLNEKSLLKKVENPKLYFECIPFLNNFIGSEINRELLVRYYFSRSSEYDETPESFSQPMKLIKDLIVRKKQLDELEEKNRELDNKIHALKKYESDLLKYRAIPVNEIELPNIEFEEKKQDLDESSRIKANLFRYNLRDNPFTYSEAFKGIENEDYSKIIVTTPTFSYFINKIKQEPTSLLNKNYVILGINGTGKTTLFEYIMHLLKIYDNKTRTIKISLEGRKDLDSLCNDFKGIFKIRLIQIMAELKNCTFADAESEYNDRIIDSLILNLFELGNAESLFIFIDNLNHFPEKIETRMQFLEFLRGFIDEINTVSTKPITLFIAGNPNWNEKIETTPSLSPFKGGIRNLETLDSQTAFEMVKTRMRYFSLEPDKFKEPDREYIDSVYVLRQKNSPLGITFRDLIDYLRLKIENGTFETSNIDINQDIISIKNIIYDLKEKEYVGLFTKFNEIYDYINKKTNGNIQKNHLYIQKLCKVLCVIYERRIVYDDSPEIEELKEYVGLLISAKIIEEGKITRQGFRINSDLQKFFVKEKNKLKIEPNSYLQYLIGFDQKLFSTDAKELWKLDLLMDSLKLQYGDFTLSLLSTIRKNYSGIFDCILELKPKLTKALLLSAKESIKYLICINCALIQPKRNIDKFLKILAEKSYDDVIEIYKDLWVANSYRIEDTERFRSGFDLMLNSKYETDDCSQFFNIFNIVFNNFRSDITNLIQFNSLYDLNEIMLDVNIKKDLNNVRRNFHNRNLDLAVDKFTVLLEKSLRHLVQSVAELIYGQDKWKRGLPESLNKKMQSGATLSNFNLNDLFLAVTENFIQYSLFLDKNEVKVIQDFISILKFSNDNTTLLMKFDEIVKLIKRVLPILEKIYNIPILFLKDKVPFSLNEKKHAPIIKRLGKIEDYSINDELCEDILRYIQEEYLDKPDFKINKEIIKELTIACIKPTHPILIHLYALINLKKAIPAKFVGSG